MFVSDQSDMGTKIIEITQHVKLSTEYIFPIPHVKELQRLNHGQNIMVMSLNLIKFSSYAIV